jgi:hypothetical protein
MTALYIDLEPKDKAATLSIMTGLRVEEHEYKMTSLLNVINGEGKGVHMLYITFVELSSSFLGTICSILFMASYGLAQIIEVWIQVFPERTLGFGQLVPLLLLSYLF